MKIKKGDTVKVLYGKERGKRGPVVAIDVKKQKVVVEGLNLYKRHLKGDGRNRTSEIVTIEKPFPLGKVMLICPLCDKPTRIMLKKGEKGMARICKKCNKEILESSKTTETKKVEKKEIKKEGKETKSKSNSKNKKK